MRITRLALKGFRNYKALDIGLSEEVTLLSGKNAQGKTNLLEGIYALSAGRSFRAAKDSEMVGWEEEAAWAKGWVKGGHADFTVAFSVSSSGRKVARLNDVEKIRPSELTEIFNVVAFIPDDLDLVKGSPAERRRFLDLHISQLSGIYREKLITYAKALAEKNALLKAYHETEGAHDLLEIYNEKLVEMGSSIIAMRMRAIKELSPKASGTYSYIAGTDERLSVSYLPSVEAGEDADEAGISRVFARKLSVLKPAEIARGGSLAGPQRDDVSLAVDGREASAFGSQGQQRTVAVSLKLAEADIITQKRGDSPVVLLDDVLSELDEGRKERLIARFVGRCQTIITATDAECAMDMPGCLPYSVEQGEVRKL